MTLLHEKHACQVLKGCATQQQSLSGRVLVILKTFRGALLLLKCQSIIKTLN